MELSDLYSQRILEIAANQPIPGRLAHPDATARRVSRICGSSIEVDVIINSDGRICAYGHDISACALGQTSAAIVAANVVGTPVREFRSLRDQMTAMLKADGAPPSGKWADLAYLEPVRDYAPRHTSTLLVFDAVVEALDKIEAGRAVKAVSLTRFVSDFWRVIDFPFKLLAYGLIQLYRYTLSAFTGRNCRHAPTCSEFTRDAIWRFGFWPGGWMGLARITRCRPGGTHGYDPVPELLPAGSHWYIPWSYGRWS